MAIFGGTGSVRLSQSICDYLGVPRGESEVIRFSEGNLFVRIRESVRGRHVYVVQSTAFPANDNFMELLFWIDALKRASAESVTAVIPYFSYAKGDKKDEPRVSIRARVCADAIEAALRPRGVAVLIEAEHQCMSTRGVRQPGVKTITTRFTGALEADASYRDRFLQMVHAARP